MRHRCVALAALLGLVALGASAPAADRPAKAAPAGRPAVVVHVASINSLLEDARYLAQMAGKEEEARQAEKMVQKQTGGKALEGVDLTKPLGLYGTLEPDLPDSRAVLLVPVADEKAFLGMLGRFGLKPEEGKGGLYQLDLPRVRLPGWLRFANGYAYATVGNPRALDPAGLPDPGSLLPAAERGTASVTVNIDRIPEEHKNFALSFLENQIALHKSKEEPNETETGKAFRQAALDDLSNRLKNMFNDGARAVLRLNVDREAGDLNLELAVAGKPGSKMARTIADLGKAPGLGAALLSGDSAMNVVAHVALPENLRKPLDAMIDEAVRKGLEKEKDEAKRKMAEPMLRALRPTLSAGELDAGFNLRGPNADGVYTLVMGVKVRGGKEVEKAVLDALENAPAQERGKVKLNVAKAGDVSIHRAEPDKKGALAEGVDLGDNPMFFAFRDDAILLAGGAGGLEAIKVAAAARPKPGKLVQVEMAMGRMAKAMAREQKSAPDVAAKVFTGADKDADKLRVTLEGGSALRLSLNMKAKLLAFFTQLDQPRKRGSSDE
jgi:hypothetical protein